MTRFTADQIEDAYSRPYILPRRVTMVLDFAKNESVELFPAYEVRVVPNQTHYVFHHVKWIKIAAFSNKQSMGEGWIPKAVLHDFAYAALVNTQVTGVSFGGDKIDYDSGINATARTIASPTLGAVMSRCADCGATLTSHKVYEDRDISEKMDKLIDMLLNVEGALTKRYGATWVPKAAGNQAIMLGMARTGNGRYILAYSGFDDTGRAMLEDVMDRLAKKVNQKGKWSLANRIPQGTVQATRRNGTQLGINDINTVFGLTAVPQITSLSDLMCAAPKLIYHAFDVLHADSLSAMTETWYEPGNQKSFQNSTGRTLRRHGQRVPSCTRCSTVVRLLLCP